jgi:hypothetical protein
MRDWEDGFVTMSLVLGEPVDARYRHKQELFVGTQNQRARALAREIATLVSDLQHLELRQLEAFS